MKLTAGMLIWVGMIVGSVAAADAGRPWLKIEHAGLSFSLPIAFRQTDREGVDSLVEEYVNEEAGIFLSYDFGMYSAKDTAPASAKREKIQIGSETGTIVTRPIEGAKEVGWAMTLYARHETPAKLTMSIACRSEAGLETARAILATVRFPSGASSSADWSRSKESFQRFRAIRENSRALLFHRDEAELYPHRLDFPAAEAVVLALPVLEIFEWREDARLAVPLLAHPDPRATLAAGRFLVWANALPADIMLLNKLLDAMPAGNMTGASQVGAAMASIGDPVAAPVLRRAMERGAYGLGSALGRLDDEKAFDFLLVSAPSSADRCEGLLELVRRSNKTVEAWMNAPSSDSQAETIAAKKWLEWWQANQATFRLVARAPRQP